MGGHRRTAVSVDGPKRTFLIQYQAGTKCNGKDGHNATPIIKCDSAEEMGFLYDGGVSGSHYGAEAVAITFCDYYPKYNGEKGTFFNNRVIGCVSVCYSGL